VELHEYQVKSLLARFGVPSPPHLVLALGCNIDAAVSKFGFESLLVKAQVHGKGRKEGGGERFVGRPQELSDAIKALLGAKIITSASGPQGFTASKVMVMSVPPVVKQFRLKIFLTTNGDVEVSLCQDGGKVFIEHPFEAAFRPFQMHRLAFSVGIRGTQADIFKKVLDGALRAFFHFDALLMEIDPLVVTENGIFQALDARMVIDDRALFRQPEVFHMKDLSQIGPRVYIPPYVCLEIGGPIGCLSNGIGLALGTADLIRLFEGIPGKVVDIGREVVEESLSKGLRMMQQEDHKVVFVNLFTGLIDGEKVARVIKKEVSRIPMVVCLEGTNAGGGRLFLQGLEPMCFVANSLDEAAQRAVGLAVLQK
jgi:succinyl-CoA synthetase beta subunit